jgi:hypothetical protein
MSRGHGHEPRSQPCSGKKETCAFEADRMIGTTLSSDLNDADYLFVIPRYWHHATHKLMDGQAVFDTIVSLSPRNLVNHN